MSPLYSFFCEKCVKYFELIIPLKNYNTEVECKYCGEKLRKLFAPCFISKVPGGLQNHHE